MVILVLFYLALWPVWMALGIGAKWLIIGRYKPGVYPLWGSYYLRWWLATGLQRLFGAGGFVGTPLMPVYYRLMGAKVGRGCALDTALVSAWDLVSIGDYTSIGPDTQLHGARVENGYLIIGRIDIGSRCFVGAHSAFGLDVRMSDDARLDDQSLLPDGAMLAPGEQRRGSPAKASDVPAPEGPIYRASLRRGLSFVALSWLIGGLVRLSSLAPDLAFLWLWLLAFRHGLIWVAVWTTAALAPVLVVVTCLWIAGLKAILLRRAKPGVYPLYSFYYLRNWLAYGLMRSSRALLLPIFTTIYLPPWMRLLGARIGRHAEISTVWSFMPELLDAGEFGVLRRRLHARRPSRIRRSFSDRRQSRGSPQLCRQWRNLAYRREPWRRLPSRRALDAAVFDAGDARRHRLARLAGVPIAQPPEGSWFRRRDHLPAEPQALCPTRRGRRAARPYPDLHRHPPWHVGIGGGSLRLRGLWHGRRVRASAALGVLAAAVAVGIVVGLKWAVMGRFRPVIAPLWSPYVWFNEMINGAYELIMAPVVSSFFGTPFAAPLLRLLGCKIGRHCYIATALFSEFDLVQIGDYVALNPGVVIQNHLFEDRIMKSST